MLNTLKLEGQYYRSTSKTLEDLKSIINTCAEKDLYLTCQCIVWSRNLGAGMRTISHAASIFIAPHLTGQEYAKRFYSAWDKKNNKGGVIFRPDDMQEISLGFQALNTGNVKLTSAMKKGFKSAIESFSNYQLLKYKSSLIDIINLVHPSGKNSQEFVTIDGEEVYTLDAIMKGMKVSADTWEVNQVKAGQIVAEAVKEGKISETEAKEVLSQAKADNWKELLNNNSLGILAAIRNLRNILLNNPDFETISKLTNLLSNAEVIKKARIFPYQIDLANEVIQTEFSDQNSRLVNQALLKGYELSIPNLAELLPGRNVVFLDRSGSMGTSIRLQKENKKGRTSCISKASLLAATIAKATNADIISFGSRAEYSSYNPNQDVFTIARGLSNANMGGTSLATAWKLAQDSGKKYDRVFILSDNECNMGSTYHAYKSYLENTGNPYVYSVDLAGYGTNSIAGDKVRYYFGYSLSIFEDIATSEFNPNYYINQVKEIVI